MRCSLRETLLKEKILRIGGGRRKNDMELLACDVDGREEVAPRLFYSPKEFGLYVKPFQTPREV